MDVLTAILACSLYLDDGLVRAVAESNSRGNPYAVIDPSYSLDAGDPGPQPRSLGAAVARMTAIIAHGGQPLLGLMQVPVLWASIYGRQVSDLFDPCVNIAIGTAQLSDFDYQCSLVTKASVRLRASKHADRLAPRLRCVLGKYAQAIRMPEFELVVRLELEHQPALHSVVSVSEAPIFYEMASWAGRPWGSDRLFFEAASSEATLVNPFAPDLIPESLSRVPKQQATDSNRGGHTEVETSPELRENR